MWFSNSVDDTYLAFDFLHIVIDMYIKAIRVSRHSSTRVATHRNLMRLYKPYLSILIKDTE